MSAWRLEDDGDAAPTAVTRPTASKSARRVFFPDGDDTDGVGAAAASCGAGATSTRRKKVGWGAELVIEDDADGQEKQSDSAGSAGASGERTSKEDPVDRSMKTSPATKVDETATADVVHGVEDSSTTSNGAYADLEAFVHYLVRSHLLHHGQDDVVKLLDLEKPCPTLSASKLQRLQQQVIGGGSAPTEASESSLERFLRTQWSRSPVSSKSSASSSRRSSKETPKAGTAETARETSRSKASSSSRRKKPALNVVVTSDNGVGETVDVADDEGYNRLNHPGSTPRASADSAASVMGEAGSTPMARGKDLAGLGLDDLDDVQPAQQQSPTLTTPSGVYHVASAPSEFSQYALAKRAASKHNKHVRLGEPGSTPTKEYVFFRETPPQFVTETVEAAVEVFASLGNDPTFRAPVLDKFVELQSSDVGKYRIGQRIDGLGAQRNVSGTVCKVFGSRQCGSSGPGSIVIDTSPEEEAGGESA